MTLLRRANSVIFFVIAFGALCALLLGLPGRTVTTAYVNDLFIFLDGSHRIAQGQVPNRDFHTALGPLVYYLPAIGYWLSGTLGGAMPVGMAVLVGALAPAAAWIVASRLRPAIGAPLGAYLLLVLAAPANLGEGVAALSFGMFYNRIGWAALGLLLVLYLPPHRHSSRQQLADAACAAGLVLLMIYIKVSYAAVGIAFLVFPLSDPRQRRWAAGALLAVLLASLGIEAAWGGSAPYLRDLLHAGEVSGSFGTPDKIAEIFQRNLRDYILFGIFVALALWSASNMKDLLFFGFCASSGFMLIAQNFQHWGIVTLGVGSAVAAERLARMAGSAGGRSRASMAAGAPLLLLGMLLPTILQTGMTLGLHTALAGFGSGVPVPLPNLDGVRLAHLWNRGENYAGFSRYFASLDDGRNALLSLDAAPERLLVLDFVNPFSAGLGLRPPEGDSTWYHWGRTLDEAHFPVPERLFKDVKVVLDPKAPIESWTADGMRRIYGGYLAEHYQLSNDTKDWKVYVARPSPGEIVNRSVCETVARSPCGAARGG